MLSTSARALLKAPLFAATVVVTLALGMGANSAIFSVVNAVILEPFGYAEESRLVVIHELARRIPAAPRLPVNAMHFQEWRDTLQSFERLAILREINLTLTGVGEPERLTAGRASASLFPMLGVQPVLGRTFVDEEERVGRDTVVILTYDFWQRRFAGASDIIGRRLTLDDQPYTVVGVLPRNFRFPRFSDLYEIPVPSTEPQLWKPFGLRDEERSVAGDFNYACIGKLRPGISSARAAAELDAAQARIDATLTDKLGLGVAVVPLGEQVTHRSQASLWMVQAASFVVLLIACVNVASLMVGRTATRGREFAVRKAIGATRRHLIAQVMTESIVLGTVAAVVGLLLASWLTQALATLTALDLPRVNEIRLSAPVWLFTIVTSLAASLLIGAMPAWRAAQAYGAESMRDSSGTATSGRPVTRARSLLIASQMALTAVGLVAAGLLVRSYANLLRVDKGFATERLMVADLNLSPRRYPDLTSMTAFVRTLLEQLPHNPGVLSAGVVGQLPLAGVGANNALFPEDRVTPPAQAPIVDFRPTNADYFATMGIPLVRGRLFGDSDRERLVAVVSASTARRAWPGENPVGKRFRLGSPQRPPIEVVGVVGDIPGVSIADGATATVYLPYWQRSFNRNRVTLVVKTSDAVDAAAATTRDTIRRIDPELAVSSLRTMSDIVDASTALRRFEMALLLLFGLAGLLLASLGIYATISYGVTVRAREIGVRMALGAARADVFRATVLGATRVAGIGLAAGLPIAVAAGYAMRASLFGVVPHDAATLIGVAIVLMATATVAAAIPAWRAARVDPINVLRAA